ncbi:MAG: hypothetical protein WC971_10450 [Coriobacteriia bacterium]
MSRDRLARLAVDIVVGVAIAALVVLVVMFASSTAPTFIYQAF